MKKMNKRGFTIVELVIVIAVIAVLAAVMIPVFSGVISDSKDASALADARTAYTNYILANEDAPADDFIFVYDEERIVVIKDGVASETIYETEAAALAVFAIEDNAATPDVNEAQTFVKDADVGNGLWTIKVAPAA